MSNPGFTWRATLYDVDAVPDNVRCACAESTIDLTAAAAEQAARLAEPPGPDETSEPPRWVHFPWRSALVKIPGPRLYCRLRLDRNRNKLTPEEQDRAGQLSIGIIGLSVGHAIAHTLALEGLAGELRLADFDDLEVTNLNRVPASLCDVGVNKAVVAARRIAELDPYLAVTVVPEGITPDNIGSFLDGLDIVIEECDSFAIKVLVRDECRARGIPVIMETSDGGTLDVSRFDLEPDRPAFHGLAGPLTAADLETLSAEEMTAHAVTILEAEQVTPRMAASALELGRTVSAWPQLGGDVALGGATVAAAVRWLAQGRDLPSGRVRLDRDSWLETLSDPLAEAPPPTNETTRDETTTDETTTDIDVDPDSLTDLQLIRFAASRAPSAGNQQPWRITVGPDAVTIALDPARTSTLDIEHRASAIAVGAALYNAEVAAASRGVLGSTTITGTGVDVQGTVRLTPSGRATAGSADLPAVLARHTRRERGTGEAPAPDDMARLIEVTATDNTRLIAITGRTEIADFASILARSDRIRFLTPELHREMFAELTDDPTDPRGIQVDDLGLPPSMRAMLDILRRDDVMALLDEWDSGDALGADAAARAESASALALVVQRGTDTATYVQTGRVVEQLWLAAEALGYAVHPMTPTALYATDDGTARGLSARHGDELVALRQELLKRWSIGADETPTCVLRLSRAAG
ncbi:Rv1355c family protein [Gordonia rhizosphera]|uniref:THIF-type NAD/FAD binding fold domain-containing protein n=1 Tax=Gordonia rhizosphera NBRC 16068 TaxID=1108045 RepID=K6WZ47_9ACTN|nr:Rv1355c family protein [Gordonia rhizosphera]GAB91799.1 hypothetical protein GORHZ_149_00050 [Gordonia rhizosphera NBRC 16068]